MKRTRIVLGLISFLVIFFVQEAVAGSVLFRPLVCVAGKSVTLRDLAVPSDIPQDLWKQIADTPLFPSPQRLGSKMRLSRRDMKKSLEKVFPAVVDLCSIPAQILIQRGGRFWDKTDLRQKVDSFLTTKVAGAKGEIVFRDHQLPSWIFSGKDGKEVHIELARKLAPGRIALRLRLQDATGRSVRRYSGSVFMDQWLTVPCAVHPLNRGQQLNLATDVNFLRKNMAYLREPVWDGRGGMWRIIRPVGSTQPLYASSLEPMPVVAKGKRCVLRFSGQYIELEVPALALQDGGIGQSVLVQNLQSKKTVVGRVVAAETVVVGSR